ncbi:hypothetical protein DFH11DRAFT_383350 [Phellopilus nigrolimitatus]|nr:hypothetical protein DFH11DRAFT_383350 [Phellopilus nigrolimitatus]
MSCRLAAQDTLVLDIFRSTVLQSMIDDRTFCVHCTQLGKHSSANPRNRTTSLSNVRLLPPNGTNGPYHTNRAGVEWRRGHNTSRYQHARRAQSPGRISGSPRPLSARSTCRPLSGSAGVRASSSIPSSASAPRRAWPALPRGTSGGDPYLWYAPRQSCCRTRLESIEGDWNAQTLARSREKTYTRTVVAERPVRGERRGFESVVVGEEEMTG